MSGDTSASIGHEVSAARADAGLSLAQVAERTRIRATVIGEIEADNFVHCGGDVYARGHLRAIGAALGVDPTPWIEAYDAEHGHSAPTATEVFESETAAPSRRRGANWSAIMAAALVVAVGLVVAQVVTTSDDSRTTTTVAEPEAPPVTDPEESEPAEKPTPIAEADPEEVVVQVTALPAGISWVQVTRSDGSVAFTGNIGSGQSKTFRDDRYLKLVLGNAAGVELTVNGQDLGAPGGQGEVASLKFTPKDPDGTAG